MIRYLSHKQINKQQWDKCISQSANQIIYANSWYLDIVAPNWDALVLDDYEAVFPLTWNNKYGIKYLHQPLFTQQLGVFSNNAVAEQLVSRFLNEAGKYFKLADINLNTVNPVHKQKFTVTEKLTHHVDLSRNYDAVSSQYSTNLKRNLNKVKSQSLSVTDNVNENEFIELLKTTFSEKLKWLNATHLHTIKKIISTCIEHKHGFFKAVRDDKDQLAASVFFAEDARHIIYLFAASNEWAKQHSAMHYIIDEVIKEKAGSDKLLDFEGSNISSLARFYKSFGAQEIYYPNIQFNTLPFYKKLPFEILKKLKKYGNKP